MTNLHHTIHHEIGDRLRDLINHSEDAPSLIAELVFDLPRMDGYIAKARDLARLESQVEQLEASAAELRSDMRELEERLEH